MTGGPEDTKPPQLQVEESTPNKQLFFKKQRIELVFDEWIKLNKPNQQIVVSPGLRSNLQTSLKGKTLRIDFPEEEELKDSTTYIINFGTAVQDLTEGNVAPNLRFVFSTGSYLDSLKVSGTIIDATTKEPVEGAYFMLYDNLSDTIFRKERPFYFASTDETGRFLIENIKADTFQIFALKENRTNYYFDQEEEFIGFSSQNIIMNDSLDLDIQMQIFQEEPRLRKPTLDLEQYGVAKLIFKREPYEAEVTYQDIGQQVLIENEKDTVHVWYQLEDNQDWDLYVQRDSLTIDTLTVEARDSIDFQKKRTLSLYKAKSIPSQIQQKPNEKIAIKFRNPLASIDTSLIKVLEDTMQTVVQTRLSLDTAAVFRNFNIRYNWQEAVPYQVKLFPGALTDMFGFQNDTIILNYQIEESKNFGNILLTVDSLDANENYIIQLMLKKEVIGEFPVTEKTQWQRSFYNLKPASPPDTYTVNIIRDSNGNGRWDTGNYEQKTQPEKIFTTSLKELKPNWDIESTVILPKE